MQRNQLNINLAKQTFGSTNGEYYRYSSSAFVVELHVVLPCCGAGYLKIIFLCLFCPSGAVSILDNKKLSFIERILVKRFCG